MADVADGLEPVADDSLLRELRTLIHEARGQVARIVNSALVLLYWRMGRRIRTEVLQSGRAEYGRRVVAELASRLTAEFGGGFDATNLARMIRFAEQFPTEEIVATLSQQLSWSHFKLLLPVANPLAREFYTEICRADGWSVRELRRKIDGMLFERTAISRKPEEVIRRELAELRQEGRLSPDLVFRDPYLLDFLGLPDSFGEKDLEEAILKELERFLLELGADFAFLARQFRITVDDTDYSLDLLFFHRRLRRLVAIELKLGRFQAGDKGQMELYLRWLDRNLRQPGEDPPVGLVLCAGKSAGHVELLRLEESGIRVAEYLTELPPAEVLERRLQQARALAEARLEHRAARFSGPAR